MKRRWAPSSDGGGSLVEGGAVMMAFHWSISGASVIRMGSISELAEVAEAEARLVSVSSVVLRPRELSFPAGLGSDDDADGGKCSNMAVVLVLVPVSLRCGNGRHSGDERGLHLLWTMDGWRPEEKAEKGAILVVDGVVITDNLAADDARGRWCKIGEKASANILPLLLPMS